MKEPQTRVDTRGVARTSRALEWLLPTALVAVLSLGCGGIAGGLGADGGVADGRSGAPRDATLDGARESTAADSGASESGATDSAARDAGDRKCKGTLLLPSVPIPLADTRPVAQWSADLNADGKLDLVVALGGSPATLLVLLGHGDGVFDPAVPYLAGDGGDTLAVGDIDGDGKPDIVTTSPQGIGVLFGFGDGTFHPPVNTGVTASSTSVATGDFDGDGRSDLALGTMVGGEGGLTEVLSVFRSNGDGTFQPPVAYAAGGAAVLVADFDGDGTLDLAGADCLGPLTVLLGRGDGTFAAVATYALGATSLATGDFNGDGSPDLVVDGTVYLGHGDGTFAIGASASSCSEDVFAVGDFDGDGNLDIVLTGEGSPYAALLLGNGDGTFTTSADYLEGGWSAVTAADFDRDGRLDLAYTTFGSAVRFGELSLVLGNGDGTFRDTASYEDPAGPGGGWAVVAADFDGDGILDLAVAVRAAGTSEMPSPGYVDVYLGKGDGTFRRPVSYAAGEQPVAIATADLDGDGELDLAVVNAGGDSRGDVETLLGRGDGTFGAASSLAAGHSPSSLAIGDFDGDGVLDLAVTDPGAGEVRVLLGKGHGRFAKASRVAAGRRPTGVTTADFDGDGALDLAVVDPTKAEVRLLFGKGDGTFAGARTFAVGKNPISVTPGDFNEDGKLDFAVSSEGLSSPFAAIPSVPPTVTVFLGRGDGSFEAGIAYPAGGGSITTGDFDGDHHLDLAAGSSSYGTVSVFLGRGDGSFAPAASYLNGGFGITTGDFNRDGRLDVASGGVTILLNEGCVR